MLIGTANADQNSLLADSVPNQQTSLGEKTNSMSNLQVQTPQYQAVSAYGGAVYAHGHQSDVAQKRPESGPISYGSAHG